MPSTCMLSIVLQLQRITPQVNFSNGTLKKSAQKSTKFGVFKSTEMRDPKKKDNKILVAETDHMTYVGQNYGPISSSRAQNVCRYYIGVLNKKSGKMRVVEAPFIEMRPQIPGEEDTNKPEIPADLDLSFREKNDKLTSAFGSSKKKRAMESRLRHQVKGEALEMALGAAVDHALSQSNAEKVTSPVKSAESSSIIPPYNKDASTPQGVYKLKDIISGAEMDAMANMAQVFMDCGRTQIEEWRTQSEYSSYVLDHVTVLPIREEARRHKACLLMYLQYLIKVYLLRAPDLRQRDPLPPDWPDMVKKKLYDEFTLKVGGDGRKVTRCMPTRLKDKLVCHILVLCLIIDEFDMTLGPLQKDLKIGQQRIITFVRALGCKFVIHKKTEFGETMSTLSAKLEVPLTFPDIEKKVPKARR